MTNIVDLVDRARIGNPRAVSRLISLIENESPGFTKAYASLYRRTGRAQIMGITGPPGSGKSTLVDKMAATFRSRGKTVGIIAVDPTSPFSGGALLGDRLRMQRHYLDEGVFIRSMGSRGHLGGVSRATSGAVDVLDAAGYDYVIVETVGVGQAEVEIASIADTVVLVLVPGLGDDIQVIKAGVMEIGDVFVVNKKDRPGADRTAAEVRMALEQNGHAPGPAGESGSRSPGPDHAPPQPTVLLTCAETGEGVAAVCDECERHAAWLRESSGLEERRIRRARLETTRITSDRMWANLAKDPGTASSALEIARRVAAREIDPYAAGDELYKMLLQRGG
ncbi:MAG: methylmalonyl Co-A mutase-associated GTPase MeaB [Firmicutes bacterium]|nr:methylmalonyl Co-A mutase-associated GTPase MeaB [Bacillota bacterium]